MLNKIITMRILVLVTLCSSIVLARYDLSADIRNSVNDPSYGSPQLIYTYVIKNDEAISTLTNRELAAVVKLAAELLNGHIFCGSNLRVMEYNSSLDALPDRRNQLHIKRPFPISFQLGEYLSSTENGFYTEPHLSTKDNYLDGRPGLRKCLYDFSSILYGSRDALAHAVYDKLIHINTLKVVNASADTILHTVLHELAHAVGFQHLKNASYFMYPSTPGYGGSLPYSQWYESYNRFFTSNEVSVMRDRSSRYNDSAIMYGGWLGHQCRSRDIDTDIQEALSEAKQTVAQSGYSFDRDYKYFMDVLRTLRIQDASAIAHSQVSGLHRTHTLMSEAMLQRELAGIRGRPVILNFFNDSLIIPSYNWDTKRFIFAAEDGTCWGVTDLTNDMWRLKMAITDPSHGRLVFSADENYYRVGVSFKNFVHSKAIMVDGQETNLSQYIDSLNPYENYGYAFYFQDAKTIHNYPLPDEPFNRTMWESSLDGSKCNDRASVYMFMYDGKAYTVTEDNYVHSGCGGSAATNQLGMSVETFIVTHICDDSIHDTDPQRDVQKAESEADITDNDSNGNPESDDDESPDLIDFGWYTGVGVVSALFIGVTAYCGTLIVRDPKKYAERYSTV